MVYEPKFIGLFSDGLQRNLEPFMLPDTAFPDLEDAFLFRGRIRRRYGNKHLGRLVERSTFASAIVPVAGNITFTDTLPNVPIAPYSVTILITDSGPPPAVIYTFTDNGAGLLSAGAGTSGTINYTTGVFVINFPALPIPVGAYGVTAVYSYYTGRPVMGLWVRETVAINAEGLIAFDTRKANLWNDAIGQFQDISFDLAGNPIQWTSTNSDFFWGTNYYVDASNNKLFWEVNNIPDSTSGAGVSQDGIRWYNGTGWTLETPQTNAAANLLRACLILIPYKDRLIALNTREGAAAPAATVNYPNRARWSQNGTPLASVDANAWRDDIPGRGGYIDAPTSEQIVSARYIKDTLVVFFERSTWQLVYTANEVLPFIWQRINSELGCESTFSTVQFDRGIFAVGDKGIITSDSVNVERIDQKIPDEVFNFHNGSGGPKRVWGIRDFYKQIVYWTFPNDDENGIFPNRMLVLNYLEGSYSFFRDCYTCFSYYQPTTDLTWARATFPWAGATGTWTSALLQSDFPYIVGGNQQGFVQVLNYQDNIPNDISLYITAATQAVQCQITSPNHNLVVGQYIRFSGIQGMTQLNGLVAQIVSVPTVNTFLIDVNSLAFGAYTRSGFITVLNGISVLTKRFNPYFQESQKCRLGYFDIFVESTTDGEFSCDLLIDETDTSPVTTNIVPTYKEYGPAIGTNKFWQRVYAQSQGQFIQFNFYLNDAQMRDQTIQESDIVIHAMILWFDRSGRLMSYDTL